jgi:hypothetical protein
MASLKLKFHSPCLLKNNLNKIQYSHNRQLKVEIQICLGRNQTDFKKWRWTQLVLQQQHHQLVLAISLNNPCLVLQTNNQQRRQILFLETNLINRPFSVLHLSKHLPNQVHFLEFLRNSSSNHRFLTLNHHNSHSLVVLRYFKRSSHHSLLVLVVLFLTHTKQFSRNRIFLERPIEISQARTFKIAFLIWAQQTERRRNESSQ